VRRLPLGPTAAFPTRFEVAPTPGGLSRFLPMITFHTRELPLVGQTSVAATPAGICMVSLEDPAGARAALQRRYPGDRILADPEPSSPCEEAFRQLEEYLAGSRKAFSLPLDPAGTPFQRQVWEAVAAIPYGERRSYAAIAAAVRRPRAVRAVGAANGANPVCILVPCHRVVGSDGRLVGYAYGLAVKERLLALEGGEW
jgi:O-6-methylguanine DNA methyltransferase